MRRTAEDAERTRVGLLEAALREFESQGWGGATLESVAARAGVTRGALHHHFRSKLALLEQALEWGWASYADKLFSGDTSLAHLLTQYVKLLQEDATFRALASCSVLVAPQASTELTERNAALDVWHDHVTALLGEDTEGSAVKPAADLFMALVKGLSVAAAIRPATLPRADALTVAFDTLAQALGSAQHPTQSSPQRDRA
ncbi:TetR/AcrR family transcriptional regulator [Microbacterium sp. MYb62]|uniref:TetR/AcrR family transcriptional regulator n=1 Tax=Microbacterium sp. MYb62 TaxID=1848690 RepID=UPI000CFCAF17|nr:TetR/AcrR family transcriptional regulator [Microbacterium sp. MYb62]PRB09705.1 TetR family transcriptional regulator [Microbacterium sp. MYb62]